MSLPDRAKQFMPFAAVKGLEEALAAVEREHALAVHPSPADEAPPPDQPT